MENKNIKSFVEFNENSNSKNSSSISDASITENWRDDLTRKITKQDIIDIISNLSVEEAADEILEIMETMTSHR